MREVRGNFKVRGIDFLFKKSKIEYNPGGKMSENESSGVLLEDGTRPPTKPKPIPRGVPPGFDPAFGRLPNPEEEAEAPPPQTDDGGNG